jgi:transcriptional regulator with XRE-family HTH domain
MVRHALNPVSRKKTDPKKQRGSPVSRVKPENQGIGARIRFFRKQRNMTLDHLSGLSNLTKSFVSKIERGVSVPSISTAMKLAESFNITVGQLLGEDNHEGAISLVRKSERRSFMRSGSSSGYDYEMLAGPKQFKSMEPYIMQPPLQFQDKRLFEHVGEEFMFVLSGSIEVELSGKSFRLNSGDVLYFDSHLPHRTRSLGKYAKVLVVVTGTTHNHS